MEADFDKAAVGYDEEFTHTKIGRLQRNRVWDYLTKIKTEHSIHNVLELNCGTGEDAQFLSSFGYNVLATDVSHSMINVAKTKSKENKNTVEFQRLDLMEPILKEKTQFDLIFSNFGGLNCIDGTHMQQLSSWLNDHLNDNAHIVLVIMPSKTLIDKWYRFVKREIQVSKTREEDNVLEVNVNGQLVTTYYFDPSTVAKHFKGFDVVHVKSIGYVPSFLTNSKFLFPLLCLDKILYQCNFRPDRSDHYLIHLQKN